MRKKINTLATYIGLLGVTLLTACSTTSHYDISKEYVALQAAILSNSQHIKYIEIPSHGAAGDSMAIAMKGAGNAASLRKALVELSDEGGGTIVVTSTNPALSKAVIEGAISEKQSMFANTMLIYAGGPSLSMELKPLILQSGMEYGFIDITKTKK